MGNYAHGNQPIQHMSYLYNYAGQPWKTQYHVRNIMDKLYSATPDGYCGDEDNGQTSAWYVFSALGFYPVAPGSDEYVLGSPLFDKATLHLQNGERFTIKGRNNNKNNVYVDSAKLNGKAFNKTFLSHQQILQGGELSFDMTNQPNKVWATSKDAVPYSMSTANPH